MAGKKKFSKEYVEKVAIAFYETPNPTTESRKIFFKYWGISKATFLRLKKEYGIEVDVKVVAKKATLL